MLTRELLVIFTCKKKFVHVEKLLLIYLFQDSFYYVLFTQVDNHFVPPLNFLAEKMKLSPSIAGITLLALGNGNIQNYYHL